MNPESVVATEPVPGLINNYQPPGTGWDEMVMPGGGVRPAWAGLAQTLEELGSQDVCRRKLELAEQLRLNGVTYNVYGDIQGAERLWSLDPVPMILESRKWEQTERGLIQRAELLDAILRDAYGPQKLMRAGLLPALFLYSHPGFQRSCSGTPAIHQRMLRFYSADLIHDSQGEFRVISDRGQNPSGYGYALENRSVLSRTFPSLFRQSGVHRLDGFFRAFRKSLSEAAPPGVTDPFVVLMSPGPDNETYFEQAYLASYLGIPLVRGGDLTPRDGGIHLLALEGSRRVDVILRRVDDAFCDPLELYGSSLLGVPGLLQAVRNRKVAVCNALGSGLLGGSGLMSFLPAICKHLFGEDLLLPSVPTYWCGDPHQREMALHRFDDMVIKPLYQGPKRSTWFVNLLTREQREKLLTRIRAKPQLYLAQEKLALSTAPCFLTDRLEARSLVVRGFLAAAEGTFSVMPGGLTRVSPRSDSFEVTGQEGGISKDTWILASETATRSTAPELAPTSIRLNRQTRPLPGYATENLFWFGRYQERLACQTRLWRGILIQSREWPDPIRTAAPDWIRLLRAFQPGFPDPTGDPRALEASLATSLHDEISVGSPAFNCAAIRRAARSVRDLMPDDCWLAVHSLINPVAEGQSRSPLPDLDQIILELSGLAGFTSEGMALGPIRRFIQMGRQLERALCTARVLKTALGRNLRPTDTLLKALLVFHDSELIYRQRYQRDIHPVAVADLLVADELNPRSIAYQLARFGEELAHFPTHESNLFTVCGKTALKALTSVRVFETAAHGGIAGAGGNEAFEYLLTSVEGWLDQMSEIMAREFFQHIPLPQSLREWT